ncbi:MAG: hypothetical protein B7Z35_02525 [Hydrogenophilales bacterium 12-61-10]|nr:MAG: hypothetical protein B7Z35_02525 [Hydrogenophilales bacterium 12-61-10]OYX30053.1 MAG: hypothetical protein B7Z03_07235 [Hydrogenophilales bacterium 32-62-9]
MNKLLLIAALAVAAFFSFVSVPDTHDQPATAARSGMSAPAADSGNTAIDEAFSSRRGNQQVEGQGAVVKLLADDNNGSRHQRFIVRLESGLTVLIAHNIDLAPRVDALRAGDVIAFSGEYEWTSKGGVIHWTHHDPQVRHPDGWLRHAGRLYQ